MNEIITKLDEIEKKAESILTEAAAEKEKMLKQLEFDKREMDGRYTSMRQKQEEEIKQQLLSEAETKITRQREHYEAAKRRLEEDFAQKKDSLAEEHYKSLMCAWRVAEKKKQRDGMGEEDGRRTVRVQWSCDKDKSDACKTAWCG